MARGTTLQELVTRVREEAGQSTNAALGRNTLGSLKAAIARHQRVLWLDHAWAHLQVERDITTSAGMRYYTPPTDLSMHHRIDAVAVRYQDRWHEVKHGIDLSHYNAIDPEAGTRQDPVQRWELFEAEQIELWPLPATNGLTVRLRGTRNLRPLVADEDPADLDDDLLVMFVAAEIAAKQKQDNASAKLQIAQRLYTKLKAENSKNREFRASGSGTGTREFRPRPRYGGKV
jgi:hypothetical protein